MKKQSEPGIYGLIIGSERNLNGSIINILIPKVFILEMIELKLE